MNGRRCECTGNICGGHKGYCGKEPYSWSTEHQNKVLCVECYEEWLPKKNLIAIVNNIGQLTAEQKKALKEALS